MTSLLRIVCVYAILGLGAGLHGQVPVIRPRGLEIGGFAGNSYGLDSYRVMGGGSVFYGLTKVILAYGEYSYFPGIERQIHGVIGDSTTPYTAYYSVPISDVHGGVQVRFPIRESRIVPYAVVGYGVLRRSAVSFDIKFQDKNGFHSFPVTSPSDAAGGLNAGGGLRYYMGRRSRYGIRLETKVYKPFGDAATGFTDTFLKAEVGFFLQLR